MLFSRPFIKRIVPFVLTLTLGLFVASFFVSLTPTFKNRNGRSYQRKQIQKLRIEKERLEIENQILKERLESTERLILLEAPAPPRPAEAFKVPQENLITIPMDSIPAAPKAR